MDALLSRVVLSAKSASIPYALRSNRINNNFSSSIFGTGTSKLAVNIRTPFPVKMSFLNLFNQKNSSTNKVSSNISAALDVKPASPSAATVSIDNDSSESYTIIQVYAPNRPGLLQLITSTFKDIGIDVSKAVVDLDKDGYVADNFYVTDMNTLKVTDEESLSYIKTCLLNVLNAKRSNISKPVNLPPRMVAVDPVPETYRRTELLYNLMDVYIKNDVASIQKSIVDHVEYTLARSRYKFDDFEAYQATAYSVRDRLIESWNDTQQYFKDQDPKRVYYLSMEYLMGRSLLNSIYNMGIKDQYIEALQQLGYELEVLAEQERDAALGNGGLGRLAACFMDSLASLNYPGWGYGIRYQYGMFRQTLKDGFQHEQPDYWLTFGNPWEIERVHVTYPIRFYGQVEEYTEDGVKRHRWTGGETVEAVAYDNPIPGYLTNNTINMRLWAAKPSGEFDLQSFNTGDYVTAILSKQRAETISSVLYPDDRTYQGKELRLKQQHFFVSATLQDVVRRYTDQHENFDEFENKVALQLNDTHPTISIVELMRILIDNEGLEWKKAWMITKKVFSFTNHTILPEALDKWSVELMQNLLPRHLQIIYDINFFFMEETRNKIGNDYIRLSRMSIIEEGEHKSIRMATLAVVASHTINGVAAVHTELIKNTIFKDFYEIWPEKFQNKTNGVTQRRWLAFCNPNLSQVISKWLKTEAWITDLDLLSGLKDHADNPDLHREWNIVRRQNKAQLAAYIEDISGVQISIDAVFDIQVKRIHEYKRQLLNVLGIIHRYDCIKKMSEQEKKRVVPRVCIIGGKAAPGYDMAKRIIKLVFSVADVINADKDIGNLLKVVFIPDYNVSVAEIIVPAADLSQHISTPGNEASGTSNMKLAMNGCIILGTFDGANIEIQEEVGTENMFLFGTKASEVGELRAERSKFVPPVQFTRVIGMIRQGKFGWAEFFAPLCDSLEKNGDFYLLGNDFTAYLEAQAGIDKAYVDRKRWTRMSILNTAGSGKFSSDRTIREYAEEIWDIKPCTRPR